MLHKPKGQTRDKRTVSNELTLDANNPIPFEYGGSSFTSINGTRYVPFFSPNDNFFSTLLEARLLSVTQNACITTKRDYTVGEGWQISNLKDGQAIDKNFEAWAAAVNNKNESLNKLIGKLAGNDLTFGNAFVEIVRGTAGGRKFIKVYLHSCLECRLANPDAEDICRSVIVSKKFKEQGIWYGSGNSTEIPLYDPLRPAASWKKDGKVERTMLHLKNEYEGYEYYGMPSNVSCLPQQVLEYETVRYNLDNLENNMQPGGVVVLQGNLTNGEANKLGRQLIKTHTGRGKRGRWVVLSSEQGINDSKIEKFNMQQDGSFLEMDRANQEKIILANQWDALLAGMQTGSALGKGNSYILSLFRIKYQTVIKPLQAKIVEGFLNPLLKIADEWQGSNWRAYDISLVTNTPVSILDSDSTLDTWTVDEVRKEAGLAELGGDKGKILFGELRKQNTNVPGQPA